ncbi:phospholipase A2%2C minor isoenzyme-like [Xyrichtys novacula]|uniref:Phospholipase A2 n=1 Tax=Xyrichtys novacula TaxID=13765 RepID=A0AAV1G6W4_XYRNO|nr:phospholipase A2%2C minor isoenzyme-like [Xyrichtys novacula]
MNLTGRLSLLLLTACVASGALLPKALWQFGKMIECAQPGISSLKCCRVHDKCYEASRKAPGCTAISDLPYVLVYDFTCSSQEVTCSATNNRCQAAVCECDRVAAHCFAQKTYNPEHKNVDPKVHCVN